MNEYRLRKFVGAVVAVGAVVVWLTVVAAVACALALFIVS